MSRITLVFPDTLCLTAFLVENEISTAEVKSLECSLTAFLSGGELTAAMTDYKAEIGRRFFTIGVHPGP